MTGEEIFAHLAADYVLVIEPHCAFLDEGGRHLGRDRLRIMVNRELALRVAGSTKIRMMSDVDVERCVQITPRGRFFFALIQ